MSDYRYERKFFISGLSKLQIESLVRMHPAIFFKIFHERFVNNIYFDSINMTNYFGTVDGNTQRVKVRIRWYGELFGTIEKPILEFKVKRGLLGKKESFPLLPFELNNHFNVQTILDIIKKTDIPEIIKDKFKYLNPVLLNRYSRKYFQSENKDFRITVDTDQSFYRIGCHNNSFLNRILDDIGVVLELKYSNKMDNYAKFITNYFPFRMTKNAKYVKGIERLYAW